MKRYFVEQLFDEDRIVLLQKKRRSRNTENIAESENQTQDVSQLELVKRINRLFEYIMEIETLSRLHARFLRDLVLIFGAEDYSFQGRSISLP